MTARTLEEIEALAEEATPGEWEAVRGSESGHCCFRYSVLSKGHHDDNSILEILCGSDADANLVVNAPRLLAIAQEQRAEIARMKSERNERNGTCDGCRHQGTCGQDHWHSSQCQARK